VHRPAFASHAPLISAHSLSVEGETADELAP
jgi:hypothetical protein